MIICTNCGKFFEDDEVGTTWQTHAWTCAGQSYDEEICVCCNCGGVLADAPKCKVCGEHFDNSNLNGVCQKCIKEYETVGTALEIGEKNTRELDINGFIATVLTEEHINKILTKWVEENFTDHSKPVVDYCEDDASFYADWLAENHGI